MKKNGFKTKLTEFHYGNTSNINFCQYFVLKILSFFYKIITVTRNFLYDKYFLDIECVNARVISVGNITTGGVGKTPVVAEAAKFYAKKYGEKVCIISRGYGGHLNNKQINVIKDNSGIKYTAYEAGDEPFWLAQNTPDDVVILTCANRVKAAEYAVNKYNATKIILDDGFQHRRLNRDCDIVLVDSEKKFGNNSLLPLGPLRESLSSLKRADRMYVVSKNIEHKKADIYAKELAAKYNKPTKVCKIEPDIIYNIGNNDILDKTQPVTVVCAIGQPQQFIKFLKDLNIIETRIFDDHHCYSYDDFEGINGNIVTTEKDAVKIKALGLHNVYALRLKTSIDLTGLLD